MKRNGKRQTSMDKFIVRSPKKSPACSPTKDRSGMRQATLESLRGVVVVEEMERAVVVLERSDVSLELKVDTLKHLLNKNPAKKVLIRTGLGKTVHKLCRSEDAKIAAAAQRVYRTWKKHILSKVNRPYIEVKCDLRTQRLRNSARQMLSEALQREDKEGGGGEREDGGGSTDRKKTNESQKGSWSGNESLSSERKKDVQEEEEKKERKSEGIKGHKMTEEDSDRKRDKGKHKKKKEKEKEESERKHKKEGGERSHTQRKEEGEEKAQKRKRQESERQEEGKEQKDKAKGEEENSEPTCQDSQQDSSSSSLSMDGLAEHIEREVYHGSKRRVDNSYRRTVRALVFTLRHQDDVRKTVSLATLSVPDFVKQYRKS